MKRELTLGTMSVPVLHVSVERIRELLNRVLPRECEMKKSAEMFGGLGKIAHLCNALHLKQATDALPTLAGLAFFMGQHSVSPRQLTIVPTPVRSVNAPAACFRCSATGRRYFFCALPVFINLIVSF